MRAYSITKSMANSSSSPTLTIINYSTPQECLEQLLIDEEQWKEYLENGKMVIRVTKYYSPLYTKGLVLWSTCHKNDLIEDIQNDLKRLIKESGYKPLDELTK